MAKSNVLKALENMEEKNVDELIFYVLYRMKDKKETNEISSKYSTLSELAYILQDYKSFVNFFSLFAGQTITVPTNEEVQDIINALLFYVCRTKDNTATDIDILKKLKIPTSKKQTLYDIIEDISDILTEYDFSSK